MMSEEDYDEQLAKAGDFHGEICGGIAIGTKLAMYGLDLMGMELNQRHKNLIVFLEIDRCMADAVQAVTKCSMGKRSLKQMYYGKFAVTFYNMDTGEALRVSDADANKKDKSQTVDGKTVIVVEVSEGRQRPYYIKALGRDGGVYVRVAGTTRLADEYMVKELLFEGSNRYYDQALCTGLNITDDDIDVLCKAMKEQAIKNAHTEEQKASMELLSSGARSTGTQSSLFITYATFVPS